MLNTVKGHEKWT